MSAITPPELNKLVIALTEAFESDPGVKAFGLGFVQDQIQQRQGTWTIPVASGIQNGSARDLLIVLDRIEDSVESKTSLDINLYLDPRLNPPVRRSA